LFGKTKIRMDARFQFVNFERGKSAGLKQFFAKKIGKI